MGRVGRKAEARVLGRVAGFGGGLGLRVTKPKVAVRMGCACSEVRSPRLWASVQSPRLVQGKQKHRDWPRHEPRAPGGRGVRPHVGKGWPDALAPLAAA